MKPKTFTAPILLIGIINAGERSLIKNNNTAMYNSAMKLTKISEWDFCKNIHYKLIVMRVAMNDASIMCEL